MIDQDAVVGLTMRKLRQIISGDADTDNANLNRSPETSHKLIADLVAKDYYLKRFPEDIRDAHVNGDIHIHDLEYFGTRPFCRSHDLRPYLMWGFKPNGGNGAIDAGAPQHAEVAILQATKILAMGQTQHSGGQGLLYGAVFLSPYMVGKTYEEIKQCVQMLIYELNQMYISRGGQVVFSSINISPGVPTVLENVRAVYKGRVGPEVYKDFEPQVKLMFQAFMEVAAKGDVDGKPFPFPKLEVAIEKKFLTEEYRELMLLAFTLAAKNGSVYFDNLLIESKESDTSVACTQCCAYSFASGENSDEKFKDRLHFNNGEHFQLGGMQVVSVNLPRIAYQADHDDKKFMTQLYNVMDIALKVYQIKKEQIVKQANKGCLSFVMQKTPTGVAHTDLNTLVFEFGIVGLNEAVQYHTGHQLHEGDNTFAKKVMYAMQEQCKMLGAFNEMKIVLARTPAETTAMRFAVCDLKGEHAEKAKGVIKGNLEEAVAHVKDTPNLPVYYSNGFAYDVAADVSLFQRLRHESEMWGYVDGGAITNVYLGESNPDPAGLMAFTIRVFQTTNIGYLAYTKDYSMCPKCHAVMGGIQETCVQCGSREVLIFSRITGYISVAGIMRDGKFETRWNAGKGEELFNRQKLNDVA